MNKVTSVLKWVWEQYKDDPLMMIFQTFAVLAIIGFCIATYGALTRPAFKTVCIDGVSYVKGYSQLAVKLDTNGQIILCKE